MLDINNDDNVNKIIKLIEDQSMEWAFGQNTKPGDEREMVANSFVEGAKTLLLLLKGDKDLISMFEDIE
jgi:hypothetical protein